MNGTVGEVLAWILYGLLVALAIFAIGYVLGRDNGFIHVASGRVVCVLKENPDKTTDWVCSTAVAQQTHK
jgi:hypothetical protein